MTLYMHFPASLDNGDLADAQKLSVKESFPLAVAYFRSRGAVIPESAKPEHFSTCSNANGALVGWRYPVTA